MPIETLTLARVLPSAANADVVPPMEDVTLSPAQQAAADGLTQGLETGDVVVLRGAAGLGRTTILSVINQKLGGGLLGMRQFMKTLDMEAVAIEQAFMDLLTSALNRHDLVILDDLHVITEIVEGSYYPRQGLLDAALIALLSMARSKGKRLLFGAAEEIPWTIERRAYAWKIGSFEAEDYECICRVYLDDGDSLDFERIHQFAPMLNAHQLRKACLWLNRKQPGPTRGRPLDTEGFIDYLRGHQLTSNVEVEEVAKVDWNDLKGVDDVIRALEAKVALPFENADLAKELGLKPKRGVLLAGPPGTGKTTVGRALAHRLKSKFFLIDGTVIAGSDNFYRQVNRVFDAARRNAPAIIFIDDADVIFNGDGEHGLCRYLLTKMDGLESASAERVCVMMTAMEPSDLPAAVLRSGRVELWLEMRLPDEEARAAIIEGHLAPLPEPLGSCDVAVLASASRGLTGADIKTIVEDGKLLFAHGKTQEERIRPVEEYFLEAIATVRANRRNYAKRKTSPLLETVKIGYRIE